MSMRCAAPKKISLLQFELRFELRTEKGGKLAFRFGRSER